MLNDALTNQMNQAIALWDEFRTTSLRDSVLQWGYNDTGLICTQLRARAYTSLAQAIEHWRFK